MGDRLAGYFLIDVQYVQLCTSIVLELTVLCS